MGYGLWGTMGHEPDLRVLSNASLTKEKPNRNLRNRLAATTILAVAPFLGYGRQAYAACVPSSGTIFICSDSSLGEDFTVNNGDFRTAANPPFVVSPNGVALDGLGHIRFTDNNASSITNTGGAGLDVRSNGNDPATSTSGAVTIISNGTIVGSTDGIYSLNQGTGSLSITLDGTVTGEAADGVEAINSSNGANFEVAIGAASSVTGSSDGLDLENEGKGHLKVTVTGDVTGENGTGIEADNNGTYLAITTGANSVVKGFEYGIEADNDGSGNLDILIRGQVIGETYDGILAANEGNALSVTTEAQSDIQGFNNGIKAENTGSGDLTVTTHGAVKGEELDGIVVANSTNGGNVAVTVGAASNVTGGDDGVQADNEGHGNLTITVNGTVTGEDANGIQAHNLGGEATNPYTGEVYHFYGVDLTITTGGSSVVAGKAYGILAFNAGTGNLQITANGEVSGEEDTGIYALNHPNAVNLTITTGAGSAITGGTTGIDARNFGKGLLKVDANGEVTGADGDGIRAFAQDGDVEVTTGGSSVVTGVDGDGIGAFASNSGNVVVKTQGTVSGSAQGIDAEAVGDGGTVLIETAASVTGGSEGIDASANSDVTVKTRGNVTGRTGINATSSSGDVLVTTAAGTTITGTSTTGIDATVSSTGDVVINARSAVTGGFRGIDAYAYDGTIDITTGAGAIRGTQENGIEAGASGNVKIKVGGDVRGGVTGIYATSALGDVADAIQITNNGTVANVSGESGDLAIRTAGSSATITNNAALIGTVELNEFADTVNNAGLWDFARGTSDFGDEADVLNNSGILRAANDKANPNEATVILNLESFNNKGLVTLADGDVGDELILKGAVAYTGRGGKLGVDVQLAPGGQADLVRIDGTTSGITYVTINATNPLSIMPNTEGIAVAIISGATANGDFDAENGSINAGFFAWDVRLDEDGHTQELYTTGLGDGAYEFAAGITALQDLWHQTNGSVLQRQADLRALLEGVGVTPVADFSEPVAPTAVARLTPGFWFRGVGAYSERDDENNGVTLDREQTTYGGLAGFDFGTQDVGDALMFGVFGGYIFSDVDFDRTNTEWNMEGPTVGIYATYLDHALHLDATVKADFLDIDIDADDIAPGAGKADTDAFNIGGQVDAGYKIGLAHGLFVDPQASLAVVHTEIDDIDDILGGAVEFDDGTSVRGRLGLRLGHETTASDGTIYSGDVTASVWQEFAGDNDATVFAPLTPATNVSDDPAETYGDVSVGFNVLAPEGWSGFLRANYLFAEDYDAIAGNAGIRYAW